MNELIDGTADGLFREISMWCIRPQTRAWPPDGEKKVLFPRLHSCEVQQHMYGAVTR